MHPGVMDILMVLPVKCFSAQTDAAHSERTAGFTQLHQFNQPWNQHSYACSLDDLCGLRSVHSHTFQHFYLVQFPPPCPTCTCCFLLSGS